MYLSKYISVNICCDSEMSDSVNVGADSDGCGSRDMDHGSGQSESPLLSPVVFPLLCPTGVRSDLSSSFPVGSARQPNVAG